MSETHIRVNGRPEPVAAGATLESIARGHGIEPGRRGVAVALNARVVPSGQWAGTPVRAGDELEFVHALQGG